MKSDQKSRIISFAKTLNSKIENEVLLDFAVEDCVGRILLYLDEDSLNKNLERIVASVVAMNYARMVDFSLNGESQREISSVSDNGQSVNYSNEKRTLLTANDDQIFIGFEVILKNHRRIRAVS